MTRTVDPLHVLGARPTGVVPAGASESIRQALESPHASRRNVATISPDHFRIVASALLKGRLVPFLGAGANLGGRPAGETWQPGGPYMPNARELATHLAERFRVEHGPLIDVADVISIRVGEAPLTEELRRVFDYDHPPTSLHRLLAAMPARMRERDGRWSRPLFVTTNYDDLLEAAFNQVGEPYDLVSYSASFRGEAPFVHVSPGGDRTAIEHKRALDLLDERPVIFKIHGSIDRLDPRLDTYVISEEDYIDLLSEDTLDEMPIPIKARLAQSDMLFLGYAMRDWDVMVALRRLRRERDRVGGFAVELPSTPEREQVLELRWRRLGFEVVFNDLAGYVAELEEAISSVEQPG